MAISISSGGGTTAVPTGSPYTGTFGGGGLTGTFPLYAPGTVGGPTSIGENQSQGSQQATTTSRSSTYIPDYAESPILRSIAQQAQNMAPQVYQWGMDQYNKNQGNINSMMRNAMAYASPQRVAQEVGRAEAGVMQGAEAGRQSAIKDLQSYGIDPSSGRYASLDQASRVMSGAAAAGAGNQQREATVGQGAQMQSAAQDLSLKNVQTGYGAANAANQFLSTAMQLKYPPLGQTSSTDSQSTGSTESSGFNLGYQGGSGAAPNTIKGVWYGGNIGAGGSAGPHYTYAEGGSVDDDATQGGFVSQELSPSAGAKTDDVDARLNSGEFVIPKDVAAWKGQEFFYKLMAQARKMRATAGQESGQGMGYADGGGDDMAMQGGYGGGYG